LDRGLADTQASVATGIDSATIPALMTVESVEIPGVMSTNRLGAFSGDD
jgi:hypothetical protein